MLARKKHVAGEPTGTTTVAGTQSAATYTSQSEVPENPVADIEKVRANMANWMDALLANFDTTPTVIDADADISAADELYTGEDRCVTELRPHKPPQRSTHSRFVSGTASSTGRPTATRTPP